VQWKRKPMHYSIAKILNMQCCALIVEHKSLISHRVR